MTHELRIATRKSALALWQAEHVRTRLLELHADLDVMVVPMTSSGDRIQDRPLAKVGGKGLFVKELEEALSRGEAELAVHSMKDVPGVLPEAFELPVILAGGDPRDAFVSNDHATLDELPAGAKLGTSSPRRRMLLCHRRPDLAVFDLRGNVQTRLRKLDEGRYDAIVLAAAGLQRVDLSHRIRQPLPREVSLPAIGQGALGVETRRGDAETRRWLESLDDPATHTRLIAERGLSARLGGSCSIPLAGHARLHEGQVTLDAMLGTPDGQTVLGETRTGPNTEPGALGVEVAERLLARGAADILSRLDENWRDPGRS